MEVFAVVAVVRVVRMRVVVAAVGVVGVQVMVDLQEDVVIARRFSSEEGGIGLVIVLPRYLWKVREQ